MPSWRSGLEEKVQASLTERGVDFKYEELTLEYVVPAKTHKYTPDFTIITRSGKLLIVETKGHWDLEDRQKMKLVVEQYPALDIRIVFQNPKNKIRRGSPTTYAQWTEKHLGIPWAAKDVPTEWLKE